MKASELFRSKPVLKCLIYAGTGSGKTRWGALAPRPLILLTEPQGLATIATWNGDAEVFEVQSYSAFWEIYACIRMGAVCEIDGQPAFRFKMGGKEIVFQTLVLDSLTDIQEKMVQHYTTNAKKEGTTLEEWGKVINSTGRLLRELRDLPVNVISLCLVQQKEGPGELPSLYGKTLPHSVGQFFNLCGFLRRMGPDQYSIFWSLSNAYCTKKPPTLRPFPNETPITSQPGAVSFGSILSYLNPDTSVAHVPGVDSPQHIESIINNSTTSK